MKRFLMTLGLAGALIVSGLNTKTANAGNETVGTIIGAVGGGLLGSTLGKGKGRIVATAAGTVIGAVLGHEITSSPDYNRYPTYEPPKPRERVVYRDRVIYRDPPPKHEGHKKHRKWNRKWERVASYDGDVLVCNKHRDHCHWRD